MGISTIARTFKFLSFLLIILTMGIKTYALNVTYYISTTGNDTNNGTSTATPWATITRANTQNLGPGDKLLFNSVGPWHNGRLNFDINDIGTLANPIVVDSYGTNPRATIYGGGVEAIYSIVSGIKIQNLELYGDRMFGGANNARGIEFYKVGTTTYSPYIYIDNCKLEGFGKAGIFIYSQNDNASTAKGFSDITIKNTSAYDCGNAGVQVFARGTTAYVQTVHLNILIDNVRASNNKGTASITTYATGNGILVSSATNVTIQNCVADKNGINNAHTAAGIAGIWYYDVDNGIIQNCEAYGNYGSQETDGNGFGIDGGCNNCIIQYCYSHDNEGGGYGLFEFGSLNAHQNNIIRYNVSQNDARKNGVGSFCLWAANNTTDRLNNDLIYNNTVYLDANNLIPLTNVINSNPIGSTMLPCGVRVLQSTVGSMNNVRFYNNTFYLDDVNANLPFVKAEDYSSTTVNVAPAYLLMQNNLYYKATNPKFLWGATYATLSAWRTARSQEKVGGTGANTGITTDPGFIWPGKGGTVAGTITGSAPSTVPLLIGGNVLSAVSAYKLKTGSSAIGAAVRLNVAPYNLSIGSTDYYNNPLASITTFDIGANEAILTATTDNYRSSTAGVWNTALTNTWNVEPTWESFTGGVWQSATVVPSSASGAITILPTNNVVVSSAVTADELTINTTGQLTINSGQTFTVNNGTGTDVDVTGTLQNSGNIANAAGNITFQNGGLYTHAFTTTAGTIPTATWVAGSTCNVAGYTANSIVPTGISGQSFQNFTWNNPSQVTPGALVSDINIAGNLTLTAGTLNLAANKLIYSGSSIARTSGNINALSGTVEFANPVGVPITLNTNVFSTNTIANVIKNGWGFVNSNTNLTVSNGLTLTLGSLFINAGTNLTVGGTITGSATNQSWLQSYATSSLILNNSTAITLPNASTPMFTFLQQPSNVAGIANLTLSGTGAVNLSSDLTIENSLTTNSGSSLVLGANNLTLNGTISSTTQIRGSATSSLTIGGSGTASIGLEQTSAATRSLLNYIQSRNATVTLSNPVQVIGVANLSGTASILGSAGNLTLVSTANTTSSVATLNGTSNISGNVNVQSYFTGGTAANYRGTRMLSSPVNDAGNIATDSTVFQQLRNRILITGPGGSGNGFDVGGGVFPNAVNLTTYNEIATNAGSQFTAVPNILFPQKVSVGQNYFLFFRGNRTGSNKFTAPFSNPENVTMTYEGIINKGTIPVSITKTNNASVNYDGLNAIGNPYPSVIDFEAFRASNSGIIDDLLSIIKPDRTGVVTYSAGVSVNKQPYAGTGTASALPVRYIQPGQGFYIRKTNYGPTTVNFMESHKVAAASPPAPARLLSAPSKNKNVIFGIKTLATPTPPTFRMNLESNNGNEETAVVFDNVYSANFDNADAPYLNNSNVNLATLDASMNNLAINFMPGIDAVSQLDLKVDASINTNCTLNFTDISPAVGKTITLRDNYLNSNTDISNSNLTYNFSIDKSIPTSFGTSRLSLLFTPGTLPVNLLSFSAKKIMDGTSLSWKTLSETENGEFIIEKSIDGKLYTTLATVKARGTGTSAIAQDYTFVDINPVLGVNYYRLKQKDINGKISEKGVISVNYDNLTEINAQAISIYPNPTQKILSVNIPKLLRQAVLLSVFDMRGELVSQHKFDACQAISIDVSSLNKGVYIIRVSNISTGELVASKKFIKE